MKIKIISNRAQPDSIQRLKKKIRRSNNFKKMIREQGLAGIILNFKKGIMTFIYKDGTKEKRIGLAKEAPVG